MSKEEKKKVSQSEPNDARLKFEAALEKKKHRSATREKRVAGEPQLSSKVSIRKSRRVFRRKAGNS